MAVYLLLVLLLQAEEYLRWDDTFVRVPKMHVGIQSKRCGIFKEMGCDGLVVDHVLHVVVPETLIDELTQQPWADDLELASKDAPSIDIAVSVVRYIWMQRMRSWQHT